MASIHYPLHDNGNEAYELRDKMKAQLGDRWSVRRIDFNKQSHKQYFDRPNWRWAVLAELDEPSVKERMAALRNKNKSPAKVETPVAEPIQKLEPKAVLVKEPEPFVSSADLVEIQEKSDFIDLMDEMGGLMTAAEVATTIGTTGNVEELNLLTVAVDGKLFYPAFQFDGTEVIDRLDDVLNVLRKRGLSDRQQATFFTLPAPVELQRIPEDKVIDILPVSSIEQIIRLARSAQL